MRDILLPLASIIITNLLEATILLNCTLAINKDQIHQQKNCDAEHWVFLRQCFYE